MMNLKVISMKKTIKMMMLFLFAATAPSCSQINENHSVGDELFILTACSIVLILLKFSNRGKKGDKFE